MNRGPTDPELIDAPCQATDPEPPDTTVPTPIPVPIDPSRPMWLRVLILAWPVFLQQSLVLVVNIYDMFLAGNNQPADPSVHVAYQDAQTTANYISWSASSLAYLASVGATALVARFIGGGDRRLARRATHQALLLAAFFGVVFSVACLTVIDDVIRLLGQAGPSADMCVQFLNPIFFLLAFQVIEMTGLACLVGAGDTRMTLYVLGGVAVVNVPLSWALFHGFGPIPEVGFPGITLGTALAHTLGAVAVVSVLFRGRAGLKLAVALFVPAWDLLWRLLRVGIPAFLDSFSLCCFQLWFLSLVNGLGDIEAAAHGIAIRTEAMGYLAGMAFGTAAAAIIGQNLGAGRPGEAARGGWITFAIGCAVMSLSGLIFYLFAPEFYAWFCPFETQQPVIDVGVPALRLVAFAMPALAAVIIFTHALRAAGDTRSPLVYTWTGFLLVRIPLAYLLTRDSLDLGALGTIECWNLGLLGAWWAMVIDLFLRGGVIVLHFATGRWQRVTV